jgi:hypothetical protein
MELPKKIEDKIVDPSNYIDGVFYFSNTSKEPFCALWNSVEYTFPPESCSPILIPDCTPIQIQEIRKRWAYKWAEQQWYEGKEYKHLVKIGRDKPAARDDKHLEPLIQMCLTPLPLKILEKKQIKRNIKLSGKSKPVGGTAPEIKDQKFDPKQDFEVSDAEANA